MDLQISFIFLSLMLHIIDPDRFHHLPYVPSSLLLMWAILIIRYMMEANDIVSPVISSRDGADRNGWYIMNHVRSLCMWNALWTWNYLHRTLVTFFWWLMARCLLGCLRGRVIRIDLFSVRGSWKSAWGLSESMRAFGPWYQKKNGWTFSSSEWS